MKNILIIVTCLFCLSCSSNIKENGHKGKNMNQVNTLSSDSIQNNSEPGKTYHQSDSETVNSDSSLVQYFLIVFISVFISLLIILIYSKTTLRNKIIRATLESNRVEVYIKSLISKKNDSQNSTKIISNGSFGAMNSKDLDLVVQKVLEIIKNENPHLFDKREDATKVIPTLMPPNEILVVPKKRTKFYSVEPRDGVSFNGSGFSDEFIATESVYFIELQNDNLAHFSIIDDNDTMGRAIKYKKDLLDMACESLSSSINAKMIKTKHPGIAQKEGNKWIIKQKAQIKYE